MSRRDQALDVEMWRSALLKLPDRVFFDIMRNYLGELRTPFNKHALIEELTSFLKNNETRRRLRQQIDETDAQVLTAVRILDSPTLNLLYGFFEGSMSYLELHYLLLNLQERLLVFIDATGRSQRVFLNPVLQRLLIDEVIDGELLFPSREYEPRSAERPWPTDSLLLALYSFLSGAPDILKADGRLKKRAAEEIASVFPSLRSHAEKTGRVQLMLTALFRLGLVADKEGVVYPLLEHWRAFSEITGSTRLALVCTAMACSRTSKNAHPGLVETSPCGSDDDLQADAEILGSLLGNLPAGKALSRSALERLLAVFALKGNSSREESRRPVTEYLSALAELGLLLVATLPSDHEEWYAINPHIAGNGDDERRQVVVEPNFQMTVKPSIDFAQGLAVVSIAEIRQFDVYPRYEVTKHSFVRGLEVEQSAQEIVELLEKLGENRLPQNVRFSFFAWEQEYRGLAFHRGIVLTADTERRHLIEHSDAMKPWIRKTLAPGVYLLDERDIVEWSRALKRSGVDPVPPVQQFNSGSGSDRPPVHFRSISRVRLLPQTTTPGQGSRRTVRCRTESGLTRELLEALEGLDLSPELHSELSARINKKLILFPRQLEQAQPTPDKNEAKGLDYVGKVRLVEQALRNPSDLLEILERTAQGTSRRLLVRPTEVSKSGNDLILHARTLPENQVVQIRVRKIGLVRKLKSSLYAP